MENSQLYRLAEGMDIPCQLKVPTEPPKWLDRDKYMRGRRFFENNTLSVLVSNYRNLVMGLSMSNLCDLLVLTQKSETIKKARGRYIDTGYFMTKWLQGPPPWEDNHLYHIVNNYHLKAAEKFRSMDKHERRLAAKDRLSELQEEDNFLKLNEKLDFVLLAGLKSVKNELFNAKSFPVYDQYLKSDMIFSQFDMAMVQVAFFASVVVFPQKYGVPETCPIESFDDFLHMWRVFGYYLGVEDKYNPVKESVSDTISLLWDIGHEVLIPSILHLDETSIHMGKCVTKAFNADYHLLIYITALSYGYEIKHLWDNFGLKQKCIYYWTTFWIEWIYPVSIFRKWINKLMLRAINKIHASRRYNNLDTQNEHSE